MRILRYLALVVVATGVAIATVHEHVERTQLGYEARGLERSLDRLREERRAALLAREQAAAPERLVARARSLGIASEADLRSLLLPLAPPPKPGSSPARH